MTLSASSAAPPWSAGSRTFSAPAKLNLFLHVVGRRDDGYHLLQTVMQLVDLADTVTIDVRDDGRIVRAVDVPGVAADDDLTIRAARLLRREAAMADEGAARQGATIAVDKRIPMGGGLGGGSSDAATTLLALNRMWHLDWSRARLAALGARLGADVPFFIGGSSAFVEGIGERVTPIVLPDAFYAIVHPGVAVPTAAIFAAPELTRDAPAIKISDFSKSGSWAALVASDAGYESGDPASSITSGPSFRNDLEPVTAVRFPAVRAALDWLSARAHSAADALATPARMSGSGACVFRSFACKADADAALAGLPAAWSAWSVRSLAAHPHADRVD